MKKPARERMSEVVERWFLREPLLFGVWTTHQLYIEPRIQTIRVHRNRIEYNPEFIEVLDKRQLEAVMRFEAVRILLKHPYLRRKENPRLTYAASNITIQEHLQIPLPLPRARDLFGSHEFDQQYFEFYYYKLQDHLGASGTTIVCDSGTSLPTLLEFYLDMDASYRENTAFWDADDLIMDRINGQIRTAQESDSWGSIPGKLREMILATLKPKLDYRSVLRQFRTSILSINRTLTRMKPSRRYGFLYMGSRRDFTTRLLFAVDVSGSISREDLKRGFSVINQFFKYGVQSIDVIQFDTEIKGKPLSLKRAKHEIGLLGRGGTSFHPVLEYIDEHRAYNGLIIFTDGFAPTPPLPKNRRTRVLWLFNHERNYRRSYEQVRSIGRAAFLRED